MSSLDIILPRFFLQNASIMTSIDIHENSTVVNDIFCSFFLLFGTGRSGAAMGGNNFTFFRKNGLFFKKQEILDYGGA